MSTLRAHDESADEQRAVSATRKNRWNWPALTLVSGMLAATLAAWGWEIASARPPQRAIIVADMLGAIGYSTTAAVLIGVFYCRRDVKLALAAGFVATYVGSYLAVSAGGSYVYSQSGLLRFNDIGLAATDRIIWQPSWLHWEPFVTIKGEHVSRCTELGRFYSPLIRLDRRLWHPTKSLFDVSAERGG